MYGVTGHGSCEYVTRYTMGRHLPLRGTGAAEGGQSAPLKDRILLDSPTPTPAITYGHAYIGIYAEDIYSRIITLQGTGCKLNVANSIVL